MSRATPILLVAGREVRSYFLQPLAWVVITAMLAFMGYAFSAVISFPGVSSAPALEIQRFLFTTLLFWLPLMVFLPVVAMRLVAEERHSGTLETLLTAPITEGQVVLGKFLGAFAFYAVLVAPFPLFVAILDWFGEVDWRAAAAGVLGLLLVGAFLLSVCLAASAVTRNQIVAAIVGFVAVLALYVAPMMAGMLARGPGWTALFSYLNLIAAMEDFSRGVVDSRHVAYTVSGTALFLFVTARLVEASKGK